MQSPDSKFIKLTYIRLRDKHTKCCASLQYAKNGIFWFMTPFNVTCRKSQRFKLLLNIYEWFCSAFYPKNAFVQIDDFDFTSTQNRSAIVIHRTQSRWLWNSLQNSHGLWSVFFFFLIKQYLKLRRHKMIFLFNKPWHIPNTNLFAFCIQWCDIIAVSA